MPVCRGWEGGRLQFGAAGFGILRLEVTHPTQPTMPKSQMFGRTKSEKTPEAVGLGQPFLGVFRIVHYIDAERHQSDQMHARSWVVVFSRSLSLSPLSLHIPFYSLMGVLCKNLYEATIGSKDPSVWHWGTVPTRNLTVRWRSIISRLDL